MLQLHGLNASKIIQLKVAESLLSPGYRRRGNHVEEAVAVGIELAHPFFGGLRGDEENIADAVALEKRPIFLQVVFQWQVGQYQSINPNLGATLQKALHAKFEDRKSTRLNSSHVRISY